MDIDVFPNSLEYWGPSGMVFFRNIQIRWMPIKGDTRLTVALERPGASGDQGQLRREHRARRCHGALSAARSLRRVPARPRLGLPRGRRHPALHRVGGQRHRPVRPLGRRHRLGHQPELEHQARRRQHPPAPGGLRRGHRELHERRHRRHRHRAQPGQPDGADQGREPAGPRRRGLPRPQLERASGRPPSATR